MEDRIRTETKQAAAGSISVYLCLTLCVILSLIFACMDTARLSAGRAAVSCALDEGLFSLFSNFDKTLFEKYGLLMLDGGYGQGTLEIGKLAKETTDYTKAVLSPTLGILGTTPEKLFRIRLEDPAVTGYLLATDEYFAPLKLQICELMKGRIGLDVAEGILNAVQTDSDTASKYAMTTGINVDGAISDYRMIETTALAAQEDEVVLASVSDNNGSNCEDEMVLASVSDNNGSNCEDEVELASVSDNNRSNCEDEVELMSLTAAADSPGTSLAVTDTGTSVAVTDTGTEVTVPEGFVNPFDSFGRLGLYSFCLPAGRSVSGASVDRSTLVGQRARNSGMNMVPLGEPGALDKILEMQYALDFFPNFLTAKEGSDRLQYQAEYVIHGSGSDSANLLYVLNWILLLREGMNYLFLETSSSKKAIIETVALIIAAIMMTPEAADVIAKGIMLLWAYFESMVDIKNLLAGKKVPLWKDDVSWQTDLTMFGFDTGVSNGSIGLGYEDYLRILMFLQSEENIVSRIADLLEYNKRKEDGQDAFRLDNCLTAFRIQYPGKIGKYSFSIERSYGYDME